VQANGIQPVSRIHVNGEGIILRGEGMPKGPERLPRESFRGNYTMIDCLFELTWSQKQEKSSDIFCQGPLMGNDFCS